MKRFLEIYIIASFLLALPFFVDFVFKTFLRVDVVSFFIEQTMEAGQIYFDILGKYIDAILYNLIPLLVASIFYWRKRYSKKFSKFSVVVVVITIFDLYLAFRGE